MTTFVRFLRFLWVAGRTLVTNYGWRRILAVLGAIWLVVSYGPKKIVGGIGKAIGAVGVWLGNAIKISAKAIWPGIVAAIKGIIKGVSGAAEGIWTALVATTKFVVRVVRHSVAFILSLIGFVLVALAMSLTFPRFAASFAPLIFGVPFILILTILIWRLGSRQRRVVRRRRYHRVAVGLLIGAFLALVVLGIIYRNTLGSAIVFTVLLAGIFLFAFAGVVRGRGGLWAKALVSIAMLAFVIGAVLAFAHLGLTLTMPQLYRAATERGNNLARSLWVRNQTQDDHEKAKTIIKEIYADRITKLRMRLEQMKSTGEDQAVIAGVYQSILELESEGDKATLPAAPPSPYRRVMYCVIAFPNESPEGDKQVLPLTNVEVRTGDRLDFVVVPTAAKGDIEGRIGSQAFAIVSGSVIASDFGMPVLTMKDPDKSFKIFINQYRREKPAPPVQPTITQVSAPISPRPVQVAVPARSVKLLITNALQENVSLYWLDENARLKRWSEEIPPGRTYEQNSYIVPGEWVILDGMNHRVDHMSPPTSDTTWVIREK